MSSAVQVISNLAARGVHVRYDGDTIWLRPKSILSEGLLAEVRRHKPELLHLLRRRCEWCVSLEIRGVPVHTCLCGYRYARGELD